MIGRIPLKGVTFVTSSTWTRTRSDITDFCNLLPTLDMCSISDDSASSSPACKALVIDCSDVDVAGSKRRLFTADSFPSDETVVHPT